MTPRAKAKPKQTPTPDVLSWSTTTRKILDLIPYDSNPRQMTSKQVEDLTASLTKFNFVEIPAVNLNNTILAGHQRLKIMALLNRGDEEIDVRIPSRQLTAAEEKEYLIRSNRNTGDWDFDILANEFDTANLIDWGFDQTELTGFLEKEAPEDFQEVDESIETAHQCPKCGYLWSGSDVSVGN